jgi:hypothetical protein
MKQDHTTDRTIGSRGDRRVPTFITVASAVILSIVAWDAALAQTSPTVGSRSSPQSTPQVTPQSPPQISPLQGADPRLKAPIGHRQPRPSDLPPNVRRDEDRPAATDRDLDERLQICRDC